MNKFDHKKIEEKWQKFWEKEKINKTSDENSGPKYYVLDMFPYPSGVGLHVGHPKGYIATDILARMKKMQGFNVLHPMGWDAFGLPAENFALKNKIHPVAMTEKNVTTFKKQLNKIGLMYDWEREINTTNPEYYKWTQWAFIQMFKKGLAYESREPIIWCPSCQTGLAMEDLEDGKCERCGSEIERKPMRQWVIRITDYADRLLADLDKLSGWEDSIKEMQRNWIGRSEGAEVEFSIVCHSEASGERAEESLKAGLKEQLKGSLADARDDKIKVFTTRPDTLFGCTYCVVAPEHELIKSEKLKVKNRKEVDEYIKKAGAKSDLERTDLNKEKSGVKLEGVMAINPVNGEEVPIFVADYVLPNYGTGAIMAVPGHDERDFEFAKKYNLPIKSVVSSCHSERIRQLADEPRNPSQSKQDEQSFSEKEVESAQDGSRSFAIAWDDKDVIGVGALIKTSDEKFLFQKRDQKTDRNPGMIAPFGGGIEGNENTNQTLKREMKEELDLEVSDDFRFINKVESYNLPGKFLDIFYLENINEKNIKLGEGEAIIKLSLAEALERDDVTPFTKKVIKSFQEKICFCGEGVNINSDFLNGLTTAEAKKKIMEWLEKESKGKRKVNYKLNDWVFSRQRYWGEPIPIIHCDKCGAVPVAEKDLPVRLPEVKNYEPTGTGESPLAGIEKWVNTKCPKCGGKAKRETNTMPQWAGSSWYYLRYIDPKNKQALVDKDKEKYWSPVDFYVGGAEHATRHLIYARFWHKFLYDIGVVNYEEPFTRFQYVGLVMAEDGRKMSKRWGNVINPDDIIDEYGADAMRVYEMFMGPFGAACAWNTNGLSGARKFLDRVCVLSDKVLPLPEGELEGVGEMIGSKKVVSLLHKTIKKVGEDITEFKFNTAVSAMMILVNAIEGKTLPAPSGHPSQEGKTLPVPSGHPSQEGKTLPVAASGGATASERGISQDDFSKFIQILAPFAPHLAEEIWQKKLGNTESIFKSAWPEYDSELIKDETVNLVIQINGKLRATISVSAGISEDEAKKFALENEVIKKWLAGKEIVKNIFVKGKLLNIVIK